MLPPAHAEALGAPSTTMVCSCSFFASRTARTSIPYVSQSCSGCPRCVAHGPRVRLRGSLAPVVGAAQGAAHRSLPQRPLGQTSRSADRPPRIHGEHAELADRRWRRPHRSPQRRRGGSPSRRRPPPHGGGPVSVHPGAVKAKETSPPTARRIQRPQLQRRRAPGDRDRGERSVTAPDDATSRSKCARGPP